MTIVPNKIHNTSFYSMIFTVYLKHLVYKPILPKYERTNPKTFYKPVLAKYERTNLITVSL